MNLTLLSLICVLGIALATLFLLRPSQSVEFCNIAEGTVAGLKTYATDAAITTRFLLGKIGTDLNHVAAAGAADIPIGVITDEAAAAEDLVNVSLFGSAGGTLKVVASAAVTVGDFVVPAASGKVKTLPGTTGTYYIIGRALMAASADGDILEIDPIPCVQRVV